ncbi:hypothetical protein MTO96_046759 [Rhipicephalus appendiculatus]
MFKFTLLLLLCAAVITTHKPLDMLRGCVANHGKRPVPGKCIMIPKRELRLNKMYMVLAEAVLQMHYTQSTGNRLITIFNVTRVGRQVSLPFLMYNVR